MLLAPRHRRWALVAVEAVTVGAGAVEGLEEAGEGAIISAGDEVLRIIKQTLFSAGVKAGGVCSPNVSRPLC